MEIAGRMVVGLLRTVRPAARSAAASVVGTDFPPSFKSKARRQRGANQSSKALVARRGNEGRKEGERASARQCPLATKPRQLCLRFMISPPISTSNSAPFVTYVFIATALVWFTTRDSDPFGAGMRISPQGSSEPGSILFSIDRHLRDIYKLAVQSISMDWSTTGVYMAYQVIFANTF